MKVEKKRKNKIFVNFFYDFAVVTGAVPGLIWLRPKRIYENPAAKKHIQGGALIVSNHASLIDPIYLMFVLWYRRQRFVCMSELTKSSVSSLFFKLARCIPIDRDNMNFDSFREIVEILKNDELVSIFPEGHVNEGENDINRFKSGAVLMSVMSGKPIIPIYIAKPKHFFSGLKAVIGEAIDPLAIYGRRPRGKELDELSELLRQRELNLMKIYEENMK